jgi:hypothetical protein
MRPVDFQDRQSLSARATAAAAAAAVTSRSKSSSNHNNDKASSPLLSKLECPQPGIAQHGFREYVAMMEGPESDRFTKLVHNKKSKLSLYLNGANYLYRYKLGDPNYGAEAKYFSSKDELTKRQGDEAIRIITECARGNCRSTSTVVAMEDHDDSSSGIIGRSSKKPPHELHESSTNNTGNGNTPAAADPFYLHVWFDAPHKPLEAIKPFYDDKRLSSLAPFRLKRMYASMVRIL